jgi:solute carrier family 25 (mitochondrial oxoglutarate transporter), member 11
LKVLYRGLDSAIFRQIFYASARLGAYEALLARLQSGDRKANNLEKAGLSFLSGAFGALVGNPFDVALIRRQASIANGKNAYKNTYTAFKTIVQKEGLGALWSGINITILRVGLINFGQLAGRDYISEAIQPLGLN